MQDLGIEGVPGACTEVGKEGVQKGETVKKGRVRGVKGGDAASGVPKGRVQPPENCCVLLKKR